MENVQYIPKDKGAFVIEENGERIAEMIIDISEGKMPVYHTEVKHEMRGHGIGSKLVHAMADYAKQNDLTVIPYCPFVQAVFRKDPEKYLDIWVKPKKNMG